MDASIRSVWAVERRVNPHVPHHGYGSIVVVYSSREDAENFIAIHPQHHYKLGVAEPITILELKELPLGKVAEWWHPSFP